MIKVMNHSRKMGEAAYASFWWLSRHFREVLTWYVILIEGRKGDRIHIFLCSPLEDTHFRWASLLR